MDSTGDTLSRRAAAGQATAARFAIQALAVIAYFALWVGAYQLSSLNLFLPAGVRFAVLWLAPPRRWVAFALADAAALLLVSWQFRECQTWAGFALATFAPWCAYAIAVLMLRRGRVYAAPESPARMGALLAAMFLAAALNALAQAAMGVLEGRDGIEHPVQFVFGYLTGDYAGQLLLVPAALQLLKPSGSRAERRRLARELAVLFVPLLVLFALLLAVGAGAALYAALMAVVPTTIAAYRHGWRGAGWAIALTGIAFGVALRMAPMPVPPDALQLLYGLFGSVALLLGAAIGSLQRMNAALADRNRLERETNERLAAQASELRDLGRRLARAREDEQARVAHELHDELGQMVTALGTGLGLLARKSSEPGVIAGLQSQRELVQRIQESIRDVLHALRPPVLDRFGLEAALREGPFERVLRDAGIAYEPLFSGPVDRIGPDVASATYRICQEAATNCVRHAQARHFRIKLDAADAWGGGLEVHLRIEDDGVGMDGDAPSRGNGLRGIRDRVLALAGDYRCDSDAGGTRHLVWMIDRTPVTRS